MNTLITITNLNVILNKKEVIKNLNLEIYKNEILTIIGKSGCGKSTLLKCILGLENYSGQVNTNNIIISYMPQDLALFDFKTVYENVILPLKITDKFIDNEKIENILKDMEILELKSKKVSELSGGQQSRVALARALVMESNVLLLDEPLSKLDYITKQNILKVIKELRDKYKITLVYVTHDIEEVLEISDRVVVLNQKVELLENINLTKLDLIDKILN